MQPELFPPSKAQGGHFGWLSHVNWGHGMIGKATVAVVVLLGVFAIIASRVPSEWAMLLVGGAAFLSLFGFLGFLGWFAKNHPDLAATEGTTYVQSRQLTLGAKHLPSLPSADLVPDPQNPTLFKPSGAE